MIVMRSPEGQDLPNRGVYLDIVKNERIVFTDAFIKAWEPSEKPFMTAILTFGEGLHNNHHRFPRDAYLSHAWYEIDINGLIILGLGKLGLVHDIFEAGARQRSRPPAAGEHAEAA